MLCMELWGLACVTSCLTILAVDLLETLLHPCATRAAHPQHFRQMPWLPPNSCQPQRQRLNHTPSTLLPPTTQVSAHLYFHIPLTQGNH